jgi:kynurenine formamidase
MAIFRTWRVNDLTCTIAPNMQVYPGDPQPKFDPQTTIKDDKVNVTRITPGSHTGTHVDAPFHFLRDGNSIDMEPPDNYIGEAIIIDASGSKSISANDLSGNNVKTNDIVLFHTGTGQRRTDFTYLDVSAAKWMVKHIESNASASTLPV